MNGISKWYVFIGLLAAAQVAATSGYVPAGVGLFLLDCALVAFWGLRALWNLRPETTVEVIETCESTLTITRDGETKRYRAPGGVRIRSDATSTEVTDWDGRPLEPVTNLLP